METDHEAEITRDNVILGGMLNVAHADTWVMKDTLRPNQHHE